MESEYIITVSSNRIFQFCVKETSKIRADKTLELFKIKFTVNEGYEITYVHWHITGNTLPV